LCTKTTFIECCKAIKENAFHTSPYPVILSLEIHVDADGQDKMARIMKNVFGDLLCDFIDCRDFSPNDLKHKILIKSKKLPKEGQTVTNDNDLLVSGLDMDEENPEEDLGITTLDESQIEQLKKK